MVPRSAPSEKATAVCQSSMPAAPRPMTMPIVAEEEWIIAVMQRRDQHAPDQVDVVVGLQRADHRHDLGHVAQRPQAAGHQVQAVEDQREAHAGERDIADLVVRARTHRSSAKMPARISPSGPSGSAIRPLPSVVPILAPMMTLIAGRSPRTPALTRPTDHDRHGGARLDDAGDEGAGEQALDGRAGDLGQQRPHLVDGQRLDAVRHEFEAEHEDAEPADHRHENVLEDIGLHWSPVSQRPPCSRGIEARGAIQNDIRSCHDRTATSAGGASKSMTARLESMMARLRAEDAEKRRRAARARLSRGLPGVRVIAAFGREKKHMTLSDVARAPDLPSPACGARSTPHLPRPGGERWPRLQADAAHHGAGVGHLGSNMVSTIVQPACERIGDRTEQSCFAAVLDGYDIVMIAHSLHGRPDVLAPTIGCAAPPSTPRPVAPS